MTRDKTDTGVTAAPSDERSQNTSAYLVTIAGIRLGEMFRLSKEETVLGRSDEADLRLIDEGVSRRHAALTVRDDKVILSDLSSANGTFCNGTRIAAPTVLKDGDKISIGGTTILKFTYQDELEERFARALYESAVKDGLTGLHSRRYFDERMRSEFAFANRHGSPLALLLIDVDHFKRVNDERGHQIGDITLCEIAHRLLSAARANDMVARFGGEEFAILCPATSETEAVTFAERLHKLIADPISAPSGAPLRITVTVGIAIAPSAGFKSDADVVKAADVALYAGKAAGRDRTEVFDVESPALERAEG